MILAVTLVAFTLGVIAGALIATRVAPRLVARLPHEERIAFARKVNRLARR